MPEAQMSVSLPRVKIVGAGIAGLSLACSLTRHKIPFTLFEEQRQQQDLGYGYAVTLQREPLRRLLNLIKDSSESAKSLRQAVACDSAVGGTGRVFDSSKANSGSFQAIDRNLRSWLVNYLVEHGVQIKYHHKLSSIRTEESGAGAVLSFENGESDVADVVVDAGGLRSCCFDSNIASPPQPKVLPYATYYGTRRMNLKDYTERFADYFGTGNKLQIKADGDDSNQPFFYVQKVHSPTKDGQTEDSRVELRWVFSRPSQGESDPLFRPNRKKEEAKEIPSALFDEILQATKGKYSKKWKKFLSDFFTTAELRKDRVLNWLLRLRLPDYQYFANNTNLDAYQMIALGDAAHGLPILLSGGTNYAMTDARLLSEAMRKAFVVGGEKRVNFHQDQAIHDSWIVEARDAVQLLREIHGQDPLSASELEGLVGKTSILRSGSPAVTEQTSDSSRDTSDGEGSHYDKPIQAKIS